MIAPFSNGIIREDMENIFHRVQDCVGILMGKTVLISGASSMIAMYFIFFLSYLNEEYNYKITILANSKTQRLKKEYKQLSKKEYLFFSDMDIGVDLFQNYKIDYIIHAAGIADPRKFASHPVEVAKSNATDTFSLLKYAKESNCRGMIFFSSASIYGRFKDKIGGIKESDMGVVNPIDEYSCYSESNRMGECWIKAFSSEYDTRAMIARIWYVYGPTIRVLDDSRVVASFMRNVLEKRSIEMYSSGDDKRSFLYLADAIVGLLYILLLGKSGEAYNLCNSKELCTIRTLAQTIVSLRPELGLDVITKQREEEDKYTVNKSNNSYYPIGDKLNSLGFQVEYSLQSGLDRTLSYLEYFYDDQALSIEKD